MKKLIIALLICLFSVSAAKATVYGHLGCGKIISGCNKSENNIDCQAQTAFVLGVLSGVSTELEMRLKDNLDQTSIKYALIKYCKSNPLKDSYDAAIDIFKQLRY